MDHSHAAGVNRAAASATLHCLTGCAIGEILGFIIGAAVGLSAGWTIALAIALAFLFGYTLSILPLLRAGLAVGAALGLVLAADTLSIATMEIVDNLVMLVIPGAMEAGMDNPLFWASMTFALGVAYLVAYPSTGFCSNGARVTRSFRSITTVVRPEERRGGGAGSLR